MELTEDLRKILDLGIALTGEKEYQRLLEKILMESMEITGCDAGTLYVTEEEGLKFMLMHNKTMNVFQGGAGEAVDLPDVPFKEENICAYSAIKKRVVNIADVYNSEEFDFQGPRNYDRMTGYHTKSMLVIPLENHAGESLGVIQLINAMDGKGSVIPFDPEYNYIIYSLASQAAVSLDNMNHLNEMKKLLYSFVSALTSAIDERTPYNANHTKNVAKYSGNLIDYINEAHVKGETPLSFTPWEREQIVMAAYLHDIGKLITPLEIMNKSTRLGKRLEVIENRLKLIKAEEKIKWLEGKMTGEEWKERQAYIENTSIFLNKVNQTVPLDDNMKAEINRLGEMTYTDESGGRLPYITEYEKRSLLIERGTLTPEERKIMEEHAVYTSKFLHEINFGREYSDVPSLAENHHEFLDGSGYPRGLSGKEIPENGRLITVLDIFDSLISERPYKKPMPVENAMKVLEEMAGEGKLDKGLVKLLEGCVKEGRLGIEN